METAKNIEQEEEDAVVSKPHSASVIKAAVYVHCYHPDLSATENTALQRTTSFVLLSSEMLTGCC